MYKHQVEIPYGEKILEVGKPNIPQIAF